MKASEIRSKFTNYFVNNGHEKISSSSLIPNNDPTLLFTNAGMNQFKHYFTGKEAAKNKRAVSIQKCVRAGGKHNDLENVGLTARHHTFFEMLGNFSFGGYFKEEAIKMAWDFLTNELKIPADKLYATVHHTDDEAFEIWNKVIGLEESRIFRKGDKDNFWEMGEFGPCGPCSEIFYDHGEQYTTPNFEPKEGQDILDDESRYVEVWNLVFMQYEKTKEGRTNLPSPCIDTGAGLERLAAVCQGKYWNYDIDSFEVIIKKIEELTNTKYSDSKYTSAIRIVADHIRSCTMLITDGVIPSNEGRGYVLRRIIRRAVKYLRDLNAPKECFYKIIPALFETMKDEYPQNVQNIDLATKFLKLEEKKFLETLDNGIKYLSKEIADSKIEKLSGDVAFKLYDTYGFPLDLTEMICLEKNITVDNEGFNQCMEERKTDSRKSWKGNSAVDDKIYYSIKEENGPTEFTGYSTLSQTSKLLAILPIGEQFGLQFDSTPFYGESGGQQGDIGIVNETIKIVDTQKPIDDLHIHLVESADGLVVGNNYELKVDAVSRLNIQNNHTATHLVQAALTKVLGNHVKQSGSSVTDDRLRFDFTHTEGLTKKEIKETEDIVNEVIAQAIKVDAKVMTKDEAEKIGAVALFGEKYGDSVRVVKIGDFSLEFCGGTHTQNTSSIRHFSIISEASLSTGIRRIEAQTGSISLNRLSERSTILNKLESLLNAKNSKTVERLESLFDDIKAKNREIKELSDKIRSNNSKEIFANPEHLKDNLVFKAVTVAEGNDLRKLSDLFVDKHPYGIVLITMERKGKFAALLRRGKSVDNVNCSDILRTGLKALNGKGGGKPDMAQGSGDIGNTENFVTIIKNELEK